MEVESFGLEFVFEFIFCAVVVVKFVELFFDRMAVTPAVQADPAIPLEDLLAQVAGVGSELVLVDADITAERPPPGRYLLLAPAAEAPAVWPAFKFLLRREAGLGVRAVEAHVIGCTRPRG